MRAIFSRPFTLNTAPKLIGLILAPLLLTGCFESRLNIDGLCNSNPELGCSNLNMGDGKCKVQRTDLIWHRYDMLKKPDDLKLIEEYKLLSQYQTCLSLAAQIQALKTTAQTQNRFDALTYSYSEQQRLTEVMREIENPHIYYFLWSHGDEQAKRKFLQLEPTGKLDTATLQYYLATYYSNRDPEHTLTILNRALDMTENGEVDERIIQSLASIHQTVGNLEMAYLWAIVGRAFNLPIATDEQLSVYYPFSDQKRSKLDATAHSIVEHLKQGTYSSALLPSEIALKAL